MSNIEARNTERELEQTQAREMDTTITPYVDVLEYQDALHLIFQLPGQTRDKLDINCEGDVLSVTSHSAAESQRDYSHKEFAQRNYARQFRVSRKYDLGQVQATYENGELELRIPKSEEEKPRKITIQ
ncbi:Hsp20/alpha crystallin family protein [Desulfurispira natronophila]|uniref:HSP20 family protein n=1 Tax=Desulfurispira natronophila TaxID=682562 RepID=A0A7W7Y4A5_9BACT|nr:Hsp20/alpha crystallin family protein [Desulfurispira natronophila]MBB5021815.1 HSP20 family protein [Desulfurispira natronophila]